MFRKALYYPWISIDNEDWLKTAVLYWSKLHTIVPESIKDPYSSGSAEILSKEGLLEPIIVNSNMPELNDIVPEVLDYIESDEGLSVLMLGRDGREFIHNDKFFHLLIERLEEARFHPDKLHHEIRTEIERALRINDRAKYGGWMSLPKSFANFYMTILANKMSRVKGVAVVSDYSLYDKLTMKIRNETRNDSSLSCPECSFKFSKYFQGRKCPKCGEHIREYKRYRSSFTPDPETISGGMLAQISLKSVSIRGNVDIKKIIKFRKENQSSFDSFRGAIQKLTSNIQAIENLETLEALQERVNSIYTNEIKPHVEMLERKLNENFISTMFGDINISGVASVLGLSFGLGSIIDKFPSVGSYALLAGAGVSVVATSFMCRRNRQIIKDDPFSYVLSVRKEFG